MEEGSSPTSSRHHPSTNAYHDTGFDTSILRSLGELKRAAAALFTRRIVLALSLGGSRLKMFSRIISSGSSGAGIIIIIISHSLDQFDWT